MIAVPTSSLLAFVRHLAIDAALAIWGGIVGGLGTFAAWISIAIVLWGPYWRQLRDIGMYTHDVESSYLISFGPFVAAAVFFLSSLLCAIALSIFGPTPRAKSLVAIISLLPAGLTFLAMQAPSFGLPITAFGTPENPYRYPLAEISVLIVGLLLSWSLVRGHSWLVRRVPAARA